MLKRSRQAYLAGNFDGVEISGSSKKNRFQHCAVRVQGAGRKVLHGPLNEQVKEWVLHVREPADGAAPRRVGRYAVMLKFVEFDASFLGHDALPVGDVAAAHRWFKSFVNFYYRWKKNYTACPL